MPEVSVLSAVAGLALAESVTLPVEAVARADVGFLVVGFFKADFAGVCAARLLLVTAASVAVLAVSEVLLLSSGCSFEVGLIEVSQNGKI